MSDGLEDVLSSPVYGRGNADHPKLAIVGMNPSYQEIREGKPFVGPSGKLLSSMLAQAGIDEADVYFTNAVKVGTPKNAEPSAELAKEWRSHLIEELQRVQPTVIVPLGNFAYKEICGRGGISRAAGQPKTTHERFGFSGTNVVPAYHPAFALRNPAYTEAIVTALSFAKRLADGTATQVEPKIVWVDKLETARAMENVADKIGAAEVLTYDIETNAREFDDPDFSIYLIAVDAGEWTFVFGPRDKSIRMGAVLLGLTPAKKVGHNAIRFDAEGLLKIEPSACKTLRYESHDTQLLDYLVNENVASHALEAACHRVLGLAEWKSLVTWDWHDTPPEEIPWEKAVEYNAKDTKATRLLYDELMPRVEADEGLLRVYNDVLRPAATAFAQVEQKGIFVDVDYCRKAIAEVYEPKIAAFKKRMCEIVGNEKFNPNSGPQVQAVIYKTLGATPFAYTPTGQPSADEATIKKLFQNTAIDARLKEFLDSLLAYRGASKIVSTYLLSYANKADEHGRVFPGYGLTTTVTGRTSSFGPNYENIPREAEVRRMISVPEGRLLLSADYSQLELRIAAMVAGEQNMLAAFERGDDLHTLFAKRITGKEEITKEERTAAKIANFLLLYGAEEYTFIENALKEYDMLFTRPEATKIRNSFHEQWPQFGDWYARCAEELQETGQIRSLTGQIRRLPQIYAQDTKDKLEALRQGINFTVQNPAGHLGIVAFTLLHETLKTTDALVVGFVHDAIHIDVPETKVVDIAEIVRDTMENQAVRYLKESGISITVPLKADIEIGRSWGDLTKLKSPSDS